MFASALAGVPAEDGDAGAAASSASPRPATVTARSAEKQHSAATTEGGEPAGADAAQLDQLYEQLIERLRRDLLTERERMGDLLGGGLS